jgi:hypothetical protein
MTFVDRTATAARNIASLAALPVRAALELVRAATRTAAAVAHRVIDELHATGPQQHPSSAAGDSRRVPAEPAAQQPTAAPPTTRSPLATRVPIKDQQKRRAAMVRGTSGRRTEQDGHAGAASPAVIRAWAVANGFEIGSRGRVPDKVRQAYTAAH